MTNARKKVSWLTAVTAKNSTAVLTMEREVSTNTTSIAQKERLGAKSWRLVIMRTAFQDVLVNRNQHHRLDQRHHKRPVRLIHTRRKRERYFMIKYIDFFIGAPPTTESTTEKNTTQAPATLPKPPPPNDGKCRQEGFIGDDKDCHKFYRCVDNGKGGLTRYEFNCAEGTAWNSELTTCDYEANVNCSSSNGTTTQAPPPCNTTTTEGSTNSTRKT